MIHTSSVVLDTMVINVIFYTHGSLDLQPILGQLSICKLLIGEQL